MLGAPGKVLQAPRNPPPQAAWAPRCCCGPVAREQSSTGAATLCRHLWTTASLGGGCSGKVLGWGLGVLGWGLANHGEDQGCLKSMVSPPGAMLQGMPGPPPHLSLQHRHGGGLHEGEGGDDEALVVAREGQLR